MENRIRKKHTQLFTVNTLGSEGGFTFLWSASSGMFAFKNKHMWPFNIGKTIHPERCGQRGLWNSHGLSIANSWSLLKLMSIKSVMPSKHLILCCPLLLPSIRVFSSESLFHIRWAKYWSVSFSISPSNEYSGWFPLWLTGLISLQSKESSPPPQLKRINSSALSFLYGPTLTPILDYRKNHSLD